MVANSVYKRPLFKRLVEGVVQGTAASVVLVTSIIGFGNITGTPTISEKADRNAEITAAGTEGIRCILTIRPDPEREYEDTQALIDKCFAHYDDLREEIIHE